MVEIKADLHFHGPIGFERHWLEVQGYQGKNLLQLFADSCFSNGIQLCAVISEQLEIVKGSIHDRLCYLSRGIRRLPKDYSAGMLEDNVIVVERENKRVYFLNGQTVAVSDEGKRYNHLVVGSNQVPNEKSIADTIKYCNDRGIIQIIQHPALKSRFGMGFKKAEKYAAECDAIEGHNAQLALPRFFSLIPIIGQYTKSSNDKSKKFAHDVNKPYISTSDGHRIEDAGIARISFDEGLLDARSEEKLFASLKEIIRSNKFSNQEGYQTFSGWIDWVSKFKAGCITGRYKR